MKDENVKKLWEHFINDENYKQYFDIDNIRDWKIKLDELKTYIDNNKKKPSYNTLGNWINTQKQKYKRRIEIMTNEEIYELWNEFINNENYKQYFDIDNIRDWTKNLDKVKQYIDANKKKPSCTHKNNNINILGRWLVAQKQLYIHTKNIMKNEEISKLWNEFINDDNYKQYFDIDNIRDWKIKLDELKTYIDDNKKRPTYYNWIHTQQTNYKNKTDIMKNEEIYKQWYEFVNDYKYKTYFLSNEDEWIQKLEEVKKYIDDNKKRPSEDSKLYNIKILGVWISSQLYNYKKKKNIMKNKEIYKQWYEFVNDYKYKTYFLSNEDEWIQKLEEVKKYIDDNKKRPSEHNKAVDSKKLGVWISVQTRNYKNKQFIMKDENVKKLWEHFINDENYKQYFLSNEDEWNQNLNKVKEYIDNNKKRPSEDSKNNDIQKIGRWINKQTKSYKLKKYIMLNNPEIYKLWTDFINDETYKQYFK